MGLEGEDPATIDPALITTRIIDIRTNNRLTLNGTHSTHFENQYMEFHKSEKLPLHANGMRFVAYDDDAQVLCF